MTKILGEPERFRGKLNAFRPMFFTGALLTWKGNNARHSDGRIDMGWESGKSIGIYDNVFKDRCKIVNAKRKIIPFNKKVRPTKK